MSLLKRIIYIRVLVIKMKWFLLLLFSVVSGQTSRYVKECLSSANPYTSFNTMENLMESVDVCLARVYVTFPSEYREAFEGRVSQCIEKIRETDRSKPEYHALEKLISQITSNTGESIIETQHVISQLEVCTNALKMITNIDVYEESRFDDVAEHFVHNLVDTDACVQMSIRHIDEHVDHVDAKLKEYKLKYAEWLEMTKYRQESAELCHELLSVLIEKVQRHILREGNS